MGRQDLAYSLCIDPVEASLARLRLFQCLFAAIETIYLMGGHVPYLAHSPSTLMEHFGKYAL